MPFILAPLLWDRLSRPFRRRAVDRERAHGDGMNVYFDSPEAFEEVLWLAHLRDAYVRADRLIPLEPSAANAEFKTAFRNTDSQVPSARGWGWRPCRGSALPLQEQRECLPPGAAGGGCCPDCRILVPFRHPLSHVSSLMRQHALFHTRHDTDVFGQQYIAWPLRVRPQLAAYRLRWLARRGATAGDRPLPKAHVPVAGCGATELRKLIGGWRAGFLDTLLDRRLYLRARACCERVHFVDFDALLTTGRASLAVIADHVGLGNPEALITSTARLRAPTTPALDVDACSSADLKAAIAVHQRLQAASADR